MHREIGSFAIASCFMPLFLEREGITRLIARLTVAIPRLQGLERPNCTLLHFSMVEQLLPT